MKERYFRKESDSGRESGPMKYSAWEINIINDEKAVAFRRMPPDDEEVVVHLQFSGEPCKWQG